MHPQDHQEVLQSLNQLMTRRAQAQAALQNHIQEFTTHLFKAIETVLTAMHESGIPGIGKSRRLVHPAGSGREGLQVFIEDWSIIFVPLPGFARPNSYDEARIPPYQFKETCGRIGVFLNDDPQGNAFYDFLIFQDGSWFAWGYGWPKQHADIAGTDFEGLALELLYSFARDIFLTWHARAQTSLATALDGKKRAYNFGLPGEEQQGG